MDMASLALATVRLVILEQETELESDEMVPPARHDCLLAWEHVVWQCSPHVFCAAVWEFHQGS